MIGVNSNPKLLLLARGLLLRRRSRDDRNKCSILSFRVQKYSVSIIETCLIQQYFTAKDWIQWPEIQPPGGHSLLVVRLHDNALVRCKCYSYCTIAVRIKDSRAGSLPTVDNYCTVDYWTPSADWLLSGTASSMVLSAHNNQQSILGHGSHNLLFVIFFDYLYSPTSRWNVNL